jgi:hypothetical protein
MSQLAVFTSLEMLFLMKKCFPVLNYILKSEITLLHPMLFHPHDGDKLVYGHVPNTLLITHEVAEIPGEHAKENEAENTPELRPNQAPDAFHGQAASPSGMVQQPTTRSTPDSMSASSTALQIASTPISTAPALVWDHAGQASTSIGTSTIVPAPISAAPASAQDCADLLPREGESGAARQAEERRVPEEIRNETSEEQFAITRPTTRAQRGIRQPRIYTDGTIRYGKYGFLTSSGEPHSLDDALANSNWRHAMNLEYDALMKNRTWRLVPPMKGRNVVGCKWVYKIKRK